MPQFFAALLALLTGVLLSALPADAQVVLNPSHPDTYTVQRGDSLWSIAGRFLQDPWRWPQLWDSNRELGNPNRIYPGDVLHLYYRDGQPRVGRRGGMRTVKLSPKVRVTQLEEPVPTIPVGAIMPFLTRAYVLDKAQIDDAPYIVAFPDEHIVAGSGDLAYARGIEGSVGAAYDIVRPGDAYIDPDSGAILGYKGRFIGEAILEHPGDPAKVKIANMDLEASVGDRVFSSKREKPQANFFPKPAPRGLQGRIISVLGGVSQIGQYNVVVLNLGSDNDVHPGQVFEVFNGGEKVPDLGKRDDFHQDWRNQPFWSQETWYGSHRVDGWMAANEPGPGFPPHVKLDRGAKSVVLPYERAGTLMIFRAFDHLSFGLIMNAERPIFVLDAVRPPPA